MVAKKKKPKTKRFPRTSRLMNDLDAQAAFRHDVYHALSRLESWAKEHTTRVLDLDERIALALGGRKLAFVTGLGDVASDPFGREEGQTRRATLASNCVSLRRGESAVVTISPYVMVTNLVLAVEEPFILQDVKVGPNSQIMSAGTHARDGGVSGCREVRCGDSAGPGTYIQARITWPDERNGLTGHL